MIKMLMFYFLKSSILYFQVKRFFAQTNSAINPRGKKNNHHKRRPGAGGDNFAAELAAFRKLSDAKKEDEELKGDEVEMEEEGAFKGEPEEGEIEISGRAEDLKPLPDILTSITQKVTQFS